MFFFSYFFFLFFVFVCLKVWINDIYPSGLSETLIGMVYVKIIKNDTPC
jgi:hypothetical protein